MTEQAQIRALHAEVLALRAERERLRGMLARAQSALEQARPFVILAGARWQERGESTASAQAVVDAIDGTEHQEATP